MHAPWFYCPVVQPGPVELPEDQVRHACRSLRLRPGDRVTLFDGRGQVAEGTLQAASVADETCRRRGVRAASTHRVLIDGLTQVSPPTRSLTLVVAACKGARLDWMVEKCTELGVTSLCLTNFARSVVRVGPQHIDRLRRVAIEACKQCRRAWLPRLNTAASLNEATQACTAETLLLAHPDPAAGWLGDYLWPARGKLTEVTVVVGPEGGLSPDELEWLSREGAHMVRLADHILRVETAAVAAAATWANLRSALDVP